MISCLQNIVSIKDQCSGVVPKSTSGYDIFQASEVKYKGMAAITDEKYVRGMNLLNAVRDNAIMEVESDFLKIITTNGYGAELGGLFHNAGQFNQGIINPMAPGEHGITIHSARPSAIRKLRVSKIEIFPVDSAANVDLNIYDNGLVSTYTVNLIGGQVNTFPVDYQASSDFIRILIDTSAIQMYSTAITCMVGCNGTMPNECGYVKGWNGTGEVKTEGFGINASFSCECNFSQLLCGWSKQFIGEIVFYKMRSLIQEERLNSDRLNNFTIYNREEAKEKQVELENKYREKWNTFAMSLPEIFKKLKDPCITCNRPQWVTNV